MYELRLNPKSFPFVLSFDVEKKKASSPAPFPVVLFIMLYKVVSSVESGDEILNCDFSTATLVAKLGEHRSAGREIVVSNPGRTNSQGL